MQKARAFFLTVGLGLMAASMILLINRPEPSDMRFREFFNVFMVVGFCIGFISILVFTNKWRKLNLVGAGIFGLGLAGMYFGGRFGGHTVGTVGWGIGLIIITLMFPAALILFSLPGLVSLVSTIQAESVSRIGFYAGLALMAVVVAVLSAIMLKSPDMDELISSLDDPDIGIRMQSIHQLGTIDNVRGRMALEGLLHDKDPVIRAEAARALGYSPSHFMAVVPLTKALRDEDMNVRRNAAHSLGALIGAQKRKMYSRTVEALIERLEDESPQVRSAAAEALGWIGDRRAIEPLIEVLDDEEVRFHAHNALISITDQRLGDNPKEWREWLEKK